MADDDRFNDGFIARTKAAREGSHGRRWDVDDIAERLGVEPDTYRKYERRTPLPQRLIYDFSRLTGIPLEELLGGKPKAGKLIPVAPLEAVQETARAKRKSR